MGGWRMLMNILYLYGSDMTFASEITCSLFTLTKPRQCMFYTSPDLLDDLGGLDSFKSELQNAHPDRNQIFDFCTGQTNGSLWHISGRP
jgi:hypothetical protein